MPYIQEVYGIPACILYSQIFSNYPSVPGHEVCGVVEAVGAKVDNF